MENTAPRASRPDLPDGYGLPTTSTGLLDWAQVEQKLVESLHYWMATVRPDGTPHLVPRWGVWLDSRFYYDGAPTTRHARNLRTNPACAMSLESGTEAVMVNGVSEPTRADPGDLGARLSAAFAKYHTAGYSPGPDSWAAEDGGGLRVLIPRRALAWFAFPTDCTRFTW